MLGVCQLSILLPSHQRQQVNLSSGVRDCSTRPLDSSTATTADGLAKNKSFSKTIKTVHMAIIPPLVPAEWDYWV